MRNEAMRTSPVMVRETILRRREHLTAFAESPRVTPNTVSQKALLSGMAFHPDLGKRSSIATEASFGREMLRAFLPLIAILAIFLSVFSIVVGIGTVAGAALDVLSIALGGLYFGIGVHMNTILTFVCIFAFVGALFGLGRR